MSDKIGRYEIKAELGRGGMATVYRAYDPRFERDVALKVLPREFLHDPTFRARFEREAKIIASLEHPAIVPVYDFGEEGGQPYLVMRFMPGGSLADRLAHGPQTIAETARIFARLAPALDEAHKRGIVHRDLKPGNILFDQYDEAYLSDFGIVKLSEASAAYTGMTIVGTPAYMSPEQAQGEAGIDNRSDVYSLGTILFEMLTGQTPYHADTPMGLAMKHVLDPVPRILEVEPNLPPDCETVVARAMAKDRDDRYSTATALAEAVVRLPSAETTVQRAIPETILEPLEPVPQGAIPGTAAAPPKPKRSRGIPAWVWILGGLIVLLIVLVPVGVALGLLAGSVVGSQADVTQTTQTQPVATATTQTQGTATAQAQETVTSQAQEMAAVTTQPPVFGPRAGQLLHTDDGLVGDREAGVDVRDFVVEAVFHNPYKTTVGSWDCGFLFRHAGANNQFRLVVESDGYWRLLDRHDDDENIIDEDSIPNLDTSAMGSNRLRLVAQGDRGLFFVNDVFVAELDLSSRTNSGDIAIATDLMERNVVDGEFTEYEDFTIWAAPEIQDPTMVQAQETATAQVQEAMTGEVGLPVFGPRDGKLLHLENDRIEARTANVDMRDFVVEAVFYNPYPTTKGGWDCGFTFRHVDGENEFALVVQSSNYWTLWNRREGQDTLVDEDRLHNLDVSDGGSNRLRLIAEGDRGLFFVNDVLVTELDLSASSDSGDVALAVDLMAHNVIDGEVTEYEDFTVWELP